MGQKNTLHALGAGRVMNFGVPGPCQGRARAVCRGQSFVIEGFDLNAHFLAQKRVGGGTVGRWVPLEGDPLAFDGDVCVEFIPAIFARHINLDVLLIYIQTP